MHRKIMAEGHDGRSVRGPLDCRFNARILDRDDPPKPAYAALQQRLQAQPRHE
jgi:hypothetical protein